MLLTGFFRHVNWEPRRKGQERAKERSEIVARVSVMCDNCLPLTFVKHF